MNLSGFDASKIEPQAVFEALPAGDYVVSIVGSKVSPTKAGTGERLELKLQILDGTFRGRVLFDGLNIRNPNAQAQQIALATLSAICRAVGVMTPRSSVELHNKPLICKVVVKEYQGELKNEVKGYKPVARQDAPSVVATQATATAGSGKAPW
jgi:hypothetical protein